MQLQLFNFTFKAMGSPCHLQFYADSPAHAQVVYQQVLQRIADLEARYSRYRADSLLSLINQRAGSGTVTPLDSETAALLAYADHCYQESEGLFDVTSGALRHAWHFDRSTLPTTAALADLLALVGWEKVQWDNDSVYLPLAGMELDFGGIVKEYAADVAANYCLSQHITSGIVELGGDVRVLGPRPNGDGWPIAIRDPRQPDKVVAEFSLTSGAVASSGDYERFQEIAGVRYSHLLNPKTGWPVSGLRAVSVIAEHCLVAGSIATIGMLKANLGAEWLSSCAIAYLCCQNDGTIFNSLTP